MAHLQMVYLLKMVIFHGYVSHNQMVYLVLWWCRTPCALNSWVCSPLKLIGIACQEFRNAVHDQPAPNKEKNLQLSSWHVNRYLDCLAGCMRISMKPECCVQLVVASSAKGWDAVFPSTKYRWGVHKTERSGYKNPGRKHIRAKNYQALLDLFAVLLQSDVRNATWFKSLLCTKNDECGDQCAHLKLDKCASTWGQDQPQQSGSRP